MADAYSPGTFGDLLQQAFAAATPEQRRAINHVGLITAAANGEPYVAGVLNASPAQSAGLRRGDRLLALDGTPFDALHSFNPPSGNDSPPWNPLPRVLSFSRNGQQQDVSLAPVFENLFDACRSATLASIQQFSNGNKVIGYVHLWVLSRNWGDLATYQGIIHSLSHCDGMILDLRHAYGALADEHLEMFRPLREPGRSSYRYYDREIVLLQNESTAAGATDFVASLSQLQRVVSLGVTTADGLPAEQTVDYPLTESVVSDPQFQAGMMTLMTIM